MIETNDRYMLLRILGFSGLAGMRSISPVALLSLFLGRQGSSEQPVAQVLASIPAQVITTSLALGELAGDKVPRAPDRTFPPALVFRALTGAGVAACIASLTARPILLDGLAGAASAVASTFVTFQARAWLARSLPLAHATLVSGLIEDTVLWISGWWLLRSILPQANKR